MKSNKNAKIKDFTDNLYKARIRLKPDKLEWLKKNKLKKSAAGFLDEILEEYKKPNLFKQKK